MTLIIGVRCTDGVVLVGDRFVINEADPERRTALKVVDLPDGSAVGVAELRWICELVMERLRVRPVKKPVTEHLVDILREVKSMDHSSEHPGYTPGQAHSVKSIMITAEGGKPRVYYSRRSEACVEVESYYHVGGDDEAFIGRCAAIAFKEPKPIIETVASAWQLIRLLEGSGREPSIGLAGLDPTVRVANDAGPVRELAAEEIDTIRRAVNRPPV